MDLLADLDVLLPSASVATRLWAAPRLEAARRQIAEGRSADRLIGELRARIDASLADVLRRCALPLNLTYPEQLPVSAARDEIVAAARRGVLVLTGETGSGKTTQLPKMLLEAGYGRAGMIALTQPRRVAAVAMAARIRDELACAEGVVAHSVRFDDRSGPDTVLRVMTDGLLLAEASRDRDLSGYDAIIIDEAHERSLNIDLLLGMLRLLRTRRPDLLVAISSASIEVERFADYFADAVGPAPIVRVGGRAFPVEVRWREPGDDDLGYLGATVQAVREIHAEQRPGDVLCFLPTERDILDAARRLHDLGGATLVPLFGRLTPKEQQRVFAPARGRKIVLATNIAETSLTIPGIVFVVDAGLSRVKRYAAASRTERLPVEPVAQASCIQRAGRAGRVEPGVCIRLYGEQDFAARAPFTDPEILRSNLAGVVVQCLAMDLGDAQALPWLDAPPPGAWHQARVLLDELGAIETGPDSTASDGSPTSTPHALRLSRLGRDLAALPADPAVARILLAGVEEGVSHEACTIASFLSVQDPRVRPLGQEAKADAAHRAFAHEGGDLASVLRLWDAWIAAPSNAARARLCDASWLGYRRMREWADVRHQLWNSLRETRRGGVALPPSGHDPDHWPLEAVHRAVLAGTLGNVLMYDREERVYRASGDRKLHVHPGSALRSGKSDDGKKAPPPPPWLVACEIVETSRLFARLCAPIDPEWVVALAGDRVKRRWRDAQWHRKRKQVVCLESVTWKGLPVREGRQVPYERIDPRDATAVFVREALAGEAAEDFIGEFPVIARNRALLVRLRRLRDRLRLGDLHLDDRALEQHYRRALGVEADGAAAAVPIASTDALRRWLRTHGERALELTPADLVDPALFERAERESPEEVEMGGRRLHLTYRFAPGEADDGATLDLVDEDLTALDPTRLDWLVPALLPEAIEEHLRALPKDVRRTLIPLADTARELAGTLARQANRQPLAEAIRAAVAQRAGSCPPLVAGALPDHLRLRLRIRDGDAVIYEGRDHAFLAGQAVASGDRLARLRVEHETPPSHAWPDGLTGLPRPVAGGGLSGHIGLARARDAAGLVAARVAVHASAEAAAAWHDDGVDALLEASLAQELDAIATAPLPGAAAARIERALGGRIGQLRRQLALARLQELDRGRIGDGDAFAALRERGRAALADLAAVDGMFERAAQKAETLRSRLKQGARSLAAAAVARGVAGDLDRLTGSSWHARLPWSSLRRLDVLLDALARRLDLAQARPADAQRLAERAEELVGEWEHALPADAGRWAQALGCARRLRELAGVLEDALLAIATPGASSSSGFAANRLRQGLAELARRIAVERSAIGDTRERLLGVRGEAQRLEGALGRRLLGEADRWLKELPDLGLGADLAGQRAAALACCERIVAASRTARPSRP